MIMLIYKKKLEQLKEIEKEHQKINGNLRVENKELQDRIDKAVEYIEQLEENEWRCFGRKILTEILKGDKEGNGSQIKHIIFANITKQNQIKEYQKIHT